MICTRFDIKAVYSLGGMVERVSEVEHLPRTGLDHALLLFSYANRVSTSMKPFRFLNFWTDHRGFKDVSRETYGDIFKQLIMSEEIAGIKEKNFEEFPSSKNRGIMQRAKAEYARYLHLEEKICIQKAGYNWFEIGDKNTIFFHSLAKEKRQKIKVTKIQNALGQWLEDDIAISQEAIAHFQNQFKQDRYQTNVTLLEHIPELISEDDNTELGNVPDEEEVKNVVFKLNGDSSSSPDGLTCRFYQDYKKQSGQKFNKEKNFYYLHQNTSAAIDIQVN
ncbi:hypothetical protein H5410_030725 [Solanum commersonii]|uniref:Uncharacterized protein n=1 Tax=Solanum commersonii TaxID=4109 RepID=A0A9J5YF39_SOLCO|nr:hypothetical protein H5410_030725 [Solanum commersonii]